MHLTPLFETTNVYTHECVYMHWDFSPSVLLLQGSVSVIGSDSQEAHALKFLERDQG